jgi:hypothetical protein
MSGWWKAMALGLGAAAVFGMPQTGMAAPIYSFSDGLYTDTTGPVDINDRGDILWSGFCDQRCRFSVDGDQGYDELPGASGQLADEINNDGDILGWSFVGNSDPIPTLWLNGIPYDLTHPANGGLEFKRDPGPRSARFNLLSLHVPDLPGEFRPTFCDWCPDGFLDEGYGANYFAPQLQQRTLNPALTNLRGDLVFQFDGRASDSYGVLTVIGQTNDVPEPQSWLLLVTAMGGAAAVTRRTKRRQ